MGCCCSCLEGNGESSKEAEMTAKTSSKAKGMRISLAMSAPTIEIEDDVKISGNGLALAGVNIEQDSAYWEWHIDTIGGCGKAEDTKFGIATKKDQKFYRNLEEQDDGAFVGFNITCCFETALLYSHIVTTIRV